MTNTVGNELCEAIAELRGVFPDWRMGQLIANLALAAGRDGESGIWDVEDEQLLAAARRLIARNLTRVVVQS